MENKESRMIDRFLNYAKIDTRSDDASATIPTSVGQMVLARVLYQEMTAMGLENIKLDERGLLIGTLPSNLPETEAERLGPIGFMAHLDTYPGYSGFEVNPQIHKNYQGGKIVLNTENGISLNPTEFPELLGYIGHDLITTDGKTLLGADDKAGIAEILEAMNFLIENPLIPRPEIKVIFSADEETDRGGLWPFAAEDFGADILFTIDGDIPGEVNFENFNAAGVKVKIKGRSVHTGEAKGKLVNSQIIGAELIIQLPRLESPEETNGYEGFFHVESMTGTIEDTEIFIMVRDFDEDRFEERLDYLRNLVASINTKWGQPAVTMEISYDYKNMRDVIAKYPELIEISKAAVIQAGLELKVKPIRGGTDGAMLAEMGIAAPNIFIGGHNYHGCYEFISIQVMEKAVETIINIAAAYGKRPGTKEN